MNSTENTQDSPLCIGNMNIYSQNIFIVVSVTCVHTIKYKHKYSTCRCIYTHTLCCVVLCCFFYGVSRSVYIIHVYIVALKLVHKQGV